MADSALYVVDLKRFRQLATGVSQMPTTNVSADEGRTG